MEQKKKGAEHSCDDNLPENKKYIRKFYKKSEKEIKRQEGEERQSDNV